MDMKIVCSVAAAVFAAQLLNAKVVSGTPFADNMVLQRDRAVPVWGTAAPGERVVVTFAGQTKSAAADATGAWRVLLDAMPASKENRTLRIAGAENAETFSNVLVGEVWFASGQSNMECPIWGGHPRYRDGKGGIMTAMTRRPFIRFAKNAHAWSAAPRHGWKAVWRDYSPESFRAAGFALSAVAFYYALEIYGALEIPVGIIDSSWGGTNIDAWTPHSAYASHPELKDVGDYPVTDKWSKSMARGPISSEIQQPSVLWNGMVAAWTPFALRGMIWYQGCHNNGEPFRYCAKMHALYDGWSKEFANPELSLYFVELAPFSCSWFNLQMSQARFAAEEKHAAMVVTCDVGNYHDIHPNDKEIVAKRLALHALKRDYGFTDITDESPTLKSWTIAPEGKFVLEFNDATGWYVYNANRSGVQGFEVAGPDGRFVPAQVLNKSNDGTLAGTALEVGAAEVKNPVRLRYLASNPWTGALYAFNSGLPVGPFQIDARRREARQRKAPARLGDALGIPELNGYRKVLAADLPAYDSIRNVGYSFNGTAQAGTFSRVAYVLELQGEDGQVDWAMASMDAFDPDVAKLGVPALSGVTIQRRVGHLTVRSNVPGVKDVTDHEGGVIEFFNSDYGPQTGLADVGGSSAVWDFNDTADGRPERPGYGCMQIHDAANGATVMAYNNFNSGASPDVGIGNCLEQNPDWTFMGNAGWYAARRLTILVK